MCSSDLFRPTAGVMVVVGGYPAECPVDAFQRIDAAVHWGFDSMLAHLLLTFQHRAGVSAYTSYFYLAGACVFGKQLHGPFLCDRLLLLQLCIHKFAAPLIPKLRGQFAEFLNKGSLARLSILNPSTCVGLRYG